MVARRPDDRATLARIAATERWGRSGTPEDRARATEPARAGLRAKFLREADPAGVLSDADREARAADLMRAHMLRMSHKAKTTRRKARRLSAEADAAEAELSRLSEDEQ